MKKVIVIGGGAGGMMAAITSAQQGNQVTLLERNEKLGKKIFITGKGRCNVTNAGDMEDLFNHVVTNSKFLYSAFYSFTNEQMMDFLTEHKCPIKTERGNRVFPQSDKSSDIIRCLQKECEQLGVTVRYQTRVQHLIIKDGKCVGVSTEKEKISADAVIIATGGKSYGSTGSTGDGYKLAMEAGHTLAKPVPSLVPLITKETEPKEMMGLSLKNVEGTFKNANGKVIYKEFGEMIFTHFGVSGPIVLSGSCYVNPWLKKGDVLLILDLKPALSKEQLDNRILRDFEGLKNSQFKNSIGKLLPRTMIPVVIKRSGINPEKQVNEITKEERQNLIQVIKEFTLTITGTRNFEEAIITQGGVKVKEVNPSTMESKCCKNLYFAGEVLDLDAKTGGYNLQIAWSTGYLAGLTE